VVDLATRKLKVNAPYVERMGEISELQPQKQDEHLQIGNLQMGNFSSPL